MNETVRRESLQVVVRRMRRFIILMFSIGVILGLAGAILYMHFGKSNDKFFHSFVIMAAVGFSFPMFTVMMRVTVRGFFMGYESMENQNTLITKITKTEEQAEPIIKKVNEVIDKAVPIAANIEEVVKRAKGMAEDVEKIAHRIREATDAINGHFDFKAIEKKLEEVAKSLMTIASIFAPMASKKPGLMVDAMIPEFDPLKAGKR